MNDITQRLEVNRQAGRENINRTAEQLRSGISTMAAQLILLGLAVEEEARLTERLDLLKELGTSHGEPSPEAQAAAQRLRTSIDSVLGGDA